MRVSHIRSFETGAGCLRLTYYTIGMRILFVNSNRADNLAVKMPNFVSYLSIIFNSVYGHIETHNKKSTTHVRHLGVLDSLLCVHMDINWVVRHIHTWTTMVRQPAKSRYQGVFTLEHALIGERDKESKTLFTSIPDSAESRLESFNPMSQFPPPILK